MFDPVWYVREYPDVASANLDPLVHFLQHGGFEGRSPNPLFDAPWYVATHFGKRGTSVNPLVHYAREGDERGLRPNPWFDPAFYRATACVPKGTNALVHYLQVGGPAALAPSAEFDPAFYNDQLAATDRAHFTSSLHHYCSIGRELGLPTARRSHGGIGAQQLRLFRDLARTQPAMLMISHPYGGGTEKHIRELAGLISHRVNTLLLTPDQCGGATLKLIQPYCSVEIAVGAGEGTKFSSFVKECRCTRVHIHHVLGFGKLARELVCALKLTFDFTVHDYYAISPEPFLTSREGRFVGEDLRGNEEALLLAGTFPHSARSLDEWQRDHAWLLAESDRVIAPSHDCARRIQAWGPPRQFVVAPHPGSWAVPRQVRAPRAIGDRPLRVAIIGVLTPHKGFQVVLECAQRAQRRKLPIHLTLIGHSTDDGALGEAGVRVSGPYHDADLPNLIGSWNGDVIWHPAQCPETFSYTLGASMNSGLPLVVPDIGAFRERVSGRASTWVKPWDTTADEWLDFFLKQREHAELGDELVQLPRPAYAENFYDSDYLYWLKD